MKKLILSSLLAFCSVAAFGQGQIIFQNGNPTAITNSSTGQKAVVSTVVGLYLNANTSATIDSPGWSLQGTTNLAAAGLFFGGTRVTSFPASQPVAVQVRAWLSSTPYASYEAAISGNAPDLFKGVSSVFVLTPTANPSPGTPIVGNGFNAIVLTPNVPEPSSIALGLLGLGAVALFRRKK